MDQNHAARVIAKHFKKPFLQNQEGRLVHNLILYEPIPVRRAIYLNAQPYNAKSLYNYMQSTSNHKPQIPHSRREMSRMEIYSVTRKATGISVQTRLQDALDAMALCHEAYLHIASFAHDDHVLSVTWSGIYRLKRRVGRRHETLLTNRDMRPIIQQLLSMTGYEPYNIMFLELEMQPRRIESELTYMIWDFPFVKGKGLHGQTVNKSAVETVRQAGALRTRRRPTGMS